MMQSYELCYVSPIADSKEFEGGRFTEPRREEDCLFGCML